MKIALISFHFAEYALLLGSALAERHEVLLILNKENAELELGSRLSDAEKPGLKIVCLPERGLINPLMLLNSVRVISEIRAFSPDVIHCQEVPYDYLMGALALLRSFPLVLTIHDHVPHTGKDTRERKRIGFYRRRLRRMPDVAIVHGERIRRESEILLPWLRNRIIAVPHGPLGEATDLVEKNWEPGALLFFGRIEQYKGLRYFIDAVKTLNTKGAVVKGIIAGTGQDLELYRAEIEADSSFELIDRYIGDDEVPGLFGRANVVVLPYTDATQSGVVAMALHYGRPVVATDVGSIGEVVREGYNGLLVPPRDVPALAHAIGRLVEDQPLSASMGRNARQLGQTELSWAAIAERTAAAYRLAVAHKSGGKGSAQPAGGAQA